MLRKPKGKESSLKNSTSTEEDQQGHRSRVEVSEKETLSSGRASEAVRSLDRHCNRNYKVPFVQLLPSPRREELSLRSSLDSGLPVNYHNVAKPAFTCTL